MPRSWWAFVLPSRRPALASGFAVLAACLLHLIAQAGMMLSWAGWSFSAFRDYYWPDQLAYLAIATNAAHGDLSAVEPFTQTGTIYYPRAYYLLIGGLADLTGTSAATMWTVVGLAFQVALVAAVGTAAVLLTRRWWTGLLGFTPFLLGTASWVTGQGWMTTMDSHAVLWGPFAVLYTLNGESVALCVAGTALLALLVVAAGRVRGRAALVVTVLAFALIGALANVHTYAFLVAVFVVAAGVAAVGLLRERSRWLLVATGLLVVVVLVAGPVVGERVSPLAALVLGLLPAAPGALALARRAGLRSLWCLGALVLGAAPQVLLTVIGLANGDEFLLYRESSSQDLGVSLLHGLVAASALLPALLLVAWLGVRRRRVLWVAVPVGGAVVWALLAANDLWGANQEPYRFWINTYLLLAVVMVPVTAWAVLDTLRPGPLPAEPGPVDVPGRAPVLLGRTGRRITAGALVLVLAVAAVASVDWLTFRREVAAMGYLTIATPQVTAAAELAEQTDGTLVLTDSCLDPLFLKVVWGGPVVSYNPGLAWPAEVDAVQALLGGRGTGTFDAAAAATADVGWVLTDSACSPSLAPSLDGYEQAGSVDYEGGTVTLWRIAS
ncbi:MAG TPA: hypothetical protein VGC67_14035 [Cellulomonas sp.]